MNETRAPKLDPKKILQAIAELDGGENSTVNFSYDPTPGPDAASARTGLYLAYLNAKNALKRKGLYRYFRPVFELVSKIVPSRYKNERRLPLASLMAYDGVHFIENAYLALLKREADAEGLCYYRDAMYRGDVSKADIIGDMLSTPEGRVQNIKIKGHRAKYTLRKWMRRFEKIPVLGYILRIAIGVILLPKNIRGFHQENIFLREQLDGVRWEYTKLRECYDSLVAEYKVSMEIVQTSFGRQIGELGHSLSGEIARAAGDLSAKSEELAQGLDRAEEKIVVHSREIARAEEKIDAKTGELAQGIARVESDSSAQANDLALLRNRFDRSQEVGLELDDSVYVALEDRFRGSMEDIKNRLLVYGDYVERLKAASGATLLDIGCGRGEWLELMRENGIDAKGVDLNARMVDSCALRGLDVTLADCVDYLSLVPADSLQAITGFQLIEHMPFKTMFHMFRLCHSAVKSGGFVIFETPNLNSLFVAAKSFHSDPTHVNKLTPETIKFYLEQSGFVRVEIIQMFARKNPEYTGRRDVDEVVYMLNMEQDCAIVGYKA